ncbi:MAG: hypothetical protein EOM69_13245, partial [Clostridia bacterium]|nr:hypothetical protein [Clostridia bacterium]
MHSHTGGSPPEEIRRETKMWTAAVVTVSDRCFAGQRADGGVGTWIETDRHPDAKDDCTGSTDPLVYQLSRATRGSSLEYAGYAALLARALDRAG